MRTLKNMLENIQGYSNWRKLTLDELKFEYMVEYPKLKAVYGDVFPDLKDFIAAARSGSVKKITKQQDRTISNRSHTQTLESLKALVSTYRYPRDVDSIVNGIKNNAKIPYPIVTRDRGGHLRVMGGNTRMDVSSILGINPHVLVIDIPEIP